MHAGKSGAFFLEKAMSRPAIVLSRLDVERIENLLDRLPPTEARQHESLRSELERAEVREPGDMPGDVVTMNSTVTFSDEGTGERITLSLVYPAAAGKPGTVSILAPVGSALLGLARGQEIDWPMPGGQPRRLRVMEINYQPESSGDLHR
jgi:regulator of nucleoside diphosphate kinase